MATSAHFKTMMSRPRPRTDVLRDLLGGPVFNERGECIGRVHNVDVEHRYAVYGSELTLRLMMSDDDHRTRPINYQHAPKPLKEKTPMFNTTATKTIDGFMVQILTSIDGRDKVIVERHVPESEVDGTEQEKWEQAKKVIRDEFLASLRSSFND